MVEVRVGSAKVVIFSDYNVAVQKQRNNFLAVKRRLCKVGLAYSLLFSARLCVVAADTMQIFTTPEEAWHWIEGIDNGATRLARLEQTGEGSPWQSHKGQRQVRVLMDRDLPAVPDLEQRIHERCIALQQAAALSSPDSLGSPSSDGVRVLLFHGHLRKAHMLPRI
ncbi:hypothetical protein NDU88_002447 [Pleurodeles waltl]|uniref:PH domain-containing protein n=1 Tax=Pleurodeles waltl TaxID=8319 RepID=A0AAV7UD77_PLEWA|nr:hypothetical protein NDU88_002447 [Pleurodeles waltl]